MSIAELDDGSDGSDARTTGAPLRRTSPPSRASSAACCCPRTRSPTSSRCSRGNDFYRPAHETVFEAILDLYGRGEPADAVTVAAELHEARRARPDRRRRLPAHADLVGADRGQRRLLRARSSASGRCCGGWSRPAPGSCSSATPPTAATSTRSSNAAQAEIYAVTERRTSEDYLPLGRDHRGRDRRDRGDRLTAAAG